MAIEKVDYLYFINFLLQTVLFFDRDLRLYQTMS